MGHRDIFLIENIIENCEKLSSYLKTNAVGENDFYENIYHQDICSFYCLQIGENANSLSEVFIQNHPGIEWRKIIGFRNVIAHDYGAVDVKILWDIVNRNIPELKRFCEKLLQKRI